MAIITETFSFLRQEKKQNTIPNKISIPGGSIKEEMTFWRKNNISLLTWFFLCYANYSKFMGGFQ